eukprot:Em0011g567a
MRQSCCFRALSPASSASDPALPVAALGEWTPYALDTLVKSWRGLPQSSQALKTWATPFQLAEVVVELPDSGGQVDQVAEEEPLCWHHLGVLAGRANQEEIIQVHPVHSSYWNQVEGSFQVDLSHHCTLTILGKQGYSIIDRRIVD